MVAIETIQSISIEFLVHVRLLDFKKSTVSNFKCAQRFCWLLLHLSKCKHTSICIYNLMPAALTWSCTLIRNLAAWIDMWQSPCGERTRDLPGCFYSWPFQGWKRDLHLGDRKVTCKKAGKSHKWPKSTMIIDLGPWPFGKTHPTSSDKIFSLQCWWIPSLVQNLEEEGKWSIKPPPPKKKT